MRIGFALAYRLGLTPWERSAPSVRAQFSGLLDREQAGRSPPYGQAVDLGCGTGGRTLELAARGWEVTGVDQVELALRRARARPGADAVRFVVGDVTDLAACGVRDGVDFFLDAGCLHSLSPDQRAACARSVTSVAAPGASLLSFCFAPTRLFLTPRGVTRDELATTFPGWELTDAVEADVTGMPAPIRNRVTPSWYRLERTAP
jgi:SAM-dependent methyltransferase